MPHLSDFIATSLTNTDKTKLVPLSLLDEIGGGLIGHDYIYIQAKGTAVENMNELKTVYASLTSPGASTNGNPRQPKTIVLGPGIYMDLGSDQMTPSSFQLNKERIDIVTLTGNCDALFLTGIHVYANDVHIKGIDSGTNAFNVNNNLPLLVLENCNGGNRSFCFGTTFSGKAINCNAGNESFAGDDDGTGGIFSGIAINCTAMGFSFGSGTGTGGTGSFTGTAINCISVDNDCFGGAHMSGKLINCRLTDADYSFPDVEIGGHLIDCINGDGSVVNSDDKSLLKKYAVTIGDGFETHFVITHGLNTIDINVQVFDSVGGLSTYTFTHTATTVTIIFSVAPSANSQRVVIIG